MRIEQIQKYASEIPTKYLDRVSEKRLAELIISTLKNSFGVTATPEDAKAIVSEVKKRRAEVVQQVSNKTEKPSDLAKRTNGEKFNLTEEIETFPGKLQTEFQQKYSSINDGEKADRLKNPYREQLLKLGDFFASDIKRKIPNLNIALGGSLVADTAVGKKHDIDLRILLPEEKDSLSDIQTISEQIQDIVPFRQQRMIDGDQRPLKHGLVHRLVLDVPEMGEVTVAVLIRPEKDYVGYGDFQRDLTTDERATYIKEKARLLEAGDHEAYEHLKSQFYLKTRRWVAKELGLYPGTPENVGNPELPVWKIMPEIIEQLKRNKRILITSETGSGKTTQIPQALYAEGFSDKGLILVVENRVVVTAETASRVADEMGVGLGKEVGYQTRHDTKRSPGTKILFITSGGLRAMLRRDPQLSDVSVVLFDEFDERELSMDFAMALTKKNQDKGGEVKFGLMSATLNADKLKDYFGEIPALEAKGRPFPVDINHSNKNIPDYKKPAEAAEKAAEFHRSNKPGHILIFMPGKAEIDAVEKELLKQKLTGVEILALHSQVSPKERRKVFVPSPNRKIIISTNIAERGVTIDGVTCVIDSGLVRQRQYDHASDTSKLPIIECAQDSIKQRAGRAGRTQPGECHRLFSESNAQKRRRETLPEIMRTPLREVVLQIKSMGYSRETAPIHLPDSPDKIAWKSAKNQLRFLGALDSEDETKLSELGLRLAELPCDPREGAMLFKAIELGCIDEIATIIAIRTARPLLYKPKNEREDAERAHGQFKKSTVSDLITQLKIYQEAERHNFNNRWCKEHYVSWKALNEIRQNRNQFLQIIKKNRGRINKETTDEQILIKSILAGLSDRIWENAGRGWYSRYNPETDDYERALLGRESGVTDASKIASSEVIEIPTRRGGKMKLITNATKVD